MATPFVSSTFSRTSGQLTRNVILQNIQRINDRINRLNEQISTGKRVLKPSDDPLAANLILDFEKRKSKNETFAKNISRANSRLRTADLSLSNMHDLAVRARELATQQANDSKNADTRAAAAEEVNQLFDEAINLGNTKFENRFLFGGSQTTEAPFKRVAGTVAYTGNVDDLQTEISDGVFSKTNLDGKEAFGALTEEVKGRVDLDPGITTETRLSVLNEGNGVSPGKITVDDGSGTPEEIDLRDADTIGDVITRINQSSDVSASISPSQNGLSLTDTTATNTVVVQEVAGGSTASDLGILTPPAGASPTPFTGNDLEPELTPQTDVSILNEGAGVGDLTSGIVITNRAPGSTFSATVDFSGANDVKDIIDTINNSGTHVKAKINEDGNGIDAVNTLQAGRLTIEENGGTTASDLGIETTLGRTPLDNLNGGRGINTVEGDDLRITRRDGTVIDVDVSGVDRVEDLETLIENDPQNTGGAGSGIDVILDDANNRIIIDDNTGGGGTLEVGNLGGSFTADDLGIKGLGSDSPPADEIQGSDLDPVGFQPESVFSGLVRLREALLNNSVSDIQNAGQLVESSSKKIINAEAEIGGKINRLKMTKNRLEEENKNLKTLLGDVNSIDMAEAATQLQLEQQTLQAALSTASRIQQMTMFNFI